MPSLHSIVSDVQDANDYDGVLLVCLKDGQISRIGFAGTHPQGMGQRQFLYRVLAEAGYTLAFSSEEAVKSSDDGASRIIKH